MATSPPKSAVNARWRLRFSLKWMLLIVTVICIWLGMTAYQASRQRKAVAAILQLGGRVSYAHQWDYSGRFGKEIKGAEPPGPAWLRKLIGDDYFVEVTYVTHGRRVTDDLLNHIAAFDELKGLYLVGSSVTDQGVKCLRGLRELRWLHLGGTEITDAALIPIRELTRLETLDL